jgi:hypothetical protein
LKSVLLVKRDISCFWHCKMWHFTV